MRKRQGLTLVEILISLVLLAVALLSLIQIPALYNKLMSVSIEKENATLYASQALDILETVNYDSVSDDILGDLSTSLDLPSDYSTQLSVLDSSGDSKNVTVTVLKGSGIGKSDVSLSRVVSPFAQSTAEDN